MFVSKMSLKTKKSTLFKSKIFYCKKHNLLKFKRSSFFKVRSGDAYVSNADLFKFTRLFQDELTLDNMTMSNLRALCRILGIAPMGTAEILRFQLTLKLRDIQNDDRVYKFLLILDYLTLFLIFLGLRFKFICNLVDCCRRRCRSTFWSRITKRLSNQRNASFRS